MDVLTHVAAIVPGIAIFLAALAVTGWYLRQLLVRGRWCWPFYLGAVCLGLALTTFGAILTWWQANASMTIVASRLAVVFATVGVALFTVSAWTRRSPELLGEPFDPTVRGLTAGERERDERRIP